MSANDIQIISAYKRKYPSCRSISVTRQTLWAADRAGHTELPVEIWIGMPNGETKIERGNVEHLLALAAT